MFRKLYEKYAAISIPKLKLFLDAKKITEKFMSSQGVHFYLLMDENRLKAAQSNELKIAEAKYLEAIHLSEQDNMYQDAAVGYYQIGMLYHAQGRYEEAVRVLNKAIELLEGLPLLENDKKQTIGDCHYHLGVIEMNKGNMESAIKHINLSKETDEAFSNVRGVCLSEATLTYIHERNS